MVVLAWYSDRDTHNASHAVKDMAREVAMICIQCQHDLPVTAFDVGSEELKIQGVPRSGRWRSVEKKIIEAHPYCACCGVTREELQKSGAGILVGHHIIPFHKDQSLELEPSNIIVLCESWGYRCCHNFMGHLGDRSWKLANPDVVVLAASMLATIRKVKTQA